MSQSGEIKTWSSIEGDVCALRGAQSNSQDMTYVYSKASYRHIARLYLTPFSTMTLLTSNHLMSIIESLEPYMSCRMNHRQICNADTRAFSLDRVYLGL